MEGDNEELVALIRPDAEDLLRMLSSQPGQRPGFVRPLLTLLMLGRTTSSGLGTTSEGNVVVYTPTTTGWAASSPTETVQAWAWPTAIVGEQNVMLFEVNGRFVAMQVC